MDGMAWKLEEAVHQLAQMTPGSPEYDLEIQKISGRLGTDTGILDLMAENFRKFEKAQDRVPDDVIEIEDKQKKSASTILVKLAMARYTFGVSTTGETYALPKSEPKIVCMLRGSKTSLRGQLAGAFFRHTGRAAPQQALADALLVVEGLAQEAEEIDLFLRVARNAGVLWLDLGDSTGRAIRITGDGWTLAEPPVLFKRTALNGPLPEPVRGGHLDELWDHLHVPASDRPLVAAWIVSSLLHDVPHPVLAFFGEQGTAKTTNQKKLVTVIDPGPVPTRKPPRDPESWVTAAAGSWIVGLDNLSDIQPWLSDSICRAVTGDGDVRRKLYTDGEHAVFAFRRVIILNGIDLGALRGDLAERVLPIHLETITESQRLSEDEIWPKWKEAHSRILGAVLDLAVSVVRLLPLVRLESKPRMADFSRILAAVDKVMGTQGLDHYFQKQTAIATDSLTGDVFTAGIIDRLMGEFTGTSAELLAHLTLEKPPKGWPSNARAVTQRLHRHAPALRKAGWKVTNDDGRNKNHAVVWTLTPPCRRPDIVGNSSSSDSLTRQNRTDGESASMTSHENGQSKKDQPKWSATI